MPFHYRDVPAWGKVNLPARPSALPDTRPGAPDLRGALPENRAFFPYQFGISPDFVGIFGT